MKGRIIKLISNDYTVLAGETQYVCKSRGKFRKLKVTPLVGDYVEFNELERYILELHPRKNELVRPPISNIDQAFIITSVKNPDFSSNLLNKLITIIEFNRIKPVICFTKIDLLEDITLVKSYMEYYRKIGYQVFQNTELDEILNSFKNQTIVFTGQTGAGKSTLLNELDPNLQIRTDEISYALGRGKHTTRHVELLPIGDGYVADTPGFSSIHFWDMTPSDIRDNFVEFNRYRENCEYRDCMHLAEKNCDIKRKVEEGEILQSRYEDYVNFVTKKERNHV